MSEDDRYDDLQSDADADAHYEAMRESVIENEGPDLAYELDRKALVWSIAFAHKLAWPAVRSELVKATDRMASDAWDEVIFHAGRAFDEYIRSVLARPVREQILSKFAEPLLEKIKEGDILRPMHSPTGGRVFASYALAVLFDSNENQAAIIDQFDAFVSKANSYNWAFRNDVFHSCVQVTEDNATTFLGTIEQLLKVIATPIVAKLRQIELEPSRVAVLEVLAQHFDENSTEYLTDSEVQKRTAMLETSTALHRLWAEGLVEAKETEVPFERAWRISPDGYNHLKSELVAFSALESGQEGADEQG